MGDLEAAADIATGGLIGHTIEPRAGDATSAHAGAHGACLNCGTALTGAFCHACGQQAHVHRTLGAIWHDILHGVLHFDGKLWRTLPMLAWRPGELTRRYIAGERARFVSPMALFLFSVFTMFAVFSIVGLSPPTDISSDTAIRAGIEETRKRIADNRREAIEDRDKLGAADPKRAELTKQIADYERDYRELGRMLPVIDARGSGNRIIGEIKTGWKRLDKGIEKANKNPGLALYKLQSNGYKFSWLLIPLSLPFVWIMFAWRRQYHGYDHAVFVTYSIAAMSILFTILSVAATIGLGEGWIFAIATFVPILHMYRQLRGAYPSTRFRTIVRTLFLSLMIVSFIFPLFLVALLGLGLLG